MAAHEVGCLSHRQDRRKGMKRLYSSDEARASAIAKQIRVLAEELGHLFSKHIPSYRDDRDVCVEELSARVRDLRETLGLDV